MDVANRKAAVAAYKERKTAARVFAVRCAATGQAWVGESRHLDTQQNGLWFARGLRAAWTAHGEGAFSLEPLERLAEDVSPYVLRTTLRERGGFWRTKLRAERL